MDEFDQKMEISEQPQEEIVEKIPGRDVYETVSSLVSALLVVVLVFTFLVRLMGVSGPSMIPTLQDGDYVALLSNLFEQFDPDSQIGRIASVMMGSTETTFYAVTVYYGAVSIKKTRHTIPAAVTADLVSVLASIFAVRLFFSG